MNPELDSRNIAVSMRKSVENLVISSQDAIGQSISQALNFSGVLSQHANQIIGQETRNVSRSPSPSLRGPEAAIEFNDSDKNDFTIQVPQHAAGDAVSIASQSDSLTSLTSTRPSDTQGKIAASPNAAKVPEAGRSKKKSWYSSLYPTYKSRSDDFKRLFKELPDDERLIVDYSCALQKEILAHGRLYVSQNYLCFYANIFGWETNLSIRWKDVTAITKEKTALVIPNAILVCTDSEKHFLTSFSGRDKAYLMLFRVWQNALMDQPMNNQEVWQWVHSCYGEELGFNSDDEGYTRDLESGEEKGALLAVDTSSELLMESGVEALCGDEAADSPRPLYGRSISQPPESLHAVTAAAVSMGNECVESRRLQQNGDVLPTDMSDTSDSDHDKHNGAEVERCTLNHEGRQVLKTEIPINIDQIFTMIFTNSKFNLELLAARGASDYIQAAWQHDPQTGVKCRQISYTIGLSSGPIGPKEVYVTETQVMNKCSKPGVLYSIDSTSDNAGIPYAEHFSVVVHYCLSRASEGATTLTVHSHVKYKKSMWPVVRGFLEKNAVGGVEDFAKLLENRLLLEAEHAPKRKPRRRRRPTTSSPETAVSVTTSIQPAVTRVVPSRPTATRSGATWWLGALLILLLINALLYWRLYAVSTTEEYAHARVSELSSEQMSEWSSLLEQHSQQLQAWRDALDTAVQTLRQTEQALSNLLTTIKPSLEKAQKDSKLHTEL